MIVDRAHAIVMSYLGLMPPGVGGGGGGGTGLPLASANAERIDRGATWSDPEVDELLNIWTNENVQAELKEATIKKHIFERIARNLREKGFYRTAEQCREKIKRLKKEYRQAKNNNYRCVRGRATVKFFPRLQAVLDGRPCPKPSFCDVAKYDAGADARDGVLHGESGNSAGLVVSATAAGGVGLSSSGGGTGSTYGLNLKTSPHPYSECSAEEIKVEVNPAEVNNDAYMHSVDSSEADPDPDVVESKRLPSSSTTTVATRHHHYHHHHRHSPNALSHSLSLTIPTYHTSRHLPSLHQLSGSSRHRGLNNGIGGFPTTSTTTTTAGVINLCTADVDQELLSAGEDGSSSHGGSCTPSALTPAPNSPSNSPHQFSKRKKSKRKSAISTQALRETLDVALDRFLKHQRESEERLFAWEERRIQMELEAEERWRQEDREMLRQIFTHLQVPSNSEPSPSSSGSHSNDR